MTAITAQLCQRTSTAAEWTAVNPVLALGEVGYESDTGRRKTGDEVRAWNQLSYDLIPWQPLTPQELPPAHQAAAGLSQRATILYLFQHLNASGGSDYGYAWLTEDEQLIVTEDAE